MHCLDLVWQDVKFKCYGKRVKVQKQKTQPTLRLSTSARLHKQMLCGPDAVGTKSERQRVANHLQPATHDYLTVGLPDHATDLQEESLSTPDSTNRAGLKLPASRHLSVSPTDASGRSRCALLPR